MHAALALSRIRPLLLYARPQLPSMCAASLGSELHGRPSSPKTPDGVLLRYMYDGGTLSQGRLCKLTPAAADVVTGSEILRSLQADGVDLRRFYTCAYWSDPDDGTSGGWLPVLPDVQDPLAERLAAVSV